MFPTEPRQAVTELYVNGGWVDVSADVYTRDPIRITGGKTDRSSATSPGQMTLTLQNGVSKVASTAGRTGCYAPRNPLGPYFGQLTRNTPIRHKLRGLAAPTFDLASNAAAGAGPFSWTHAGSARTTGVLVTVVQSGSTTFQTVSVSYGDWNVPLVGSVASATGRIYTFFLGVNVVRGSQTVTVSPAVPGPTMRAVAITVTGGNATELNNTPVAVTNTTANPSVSVATTQLALLLGVLHSGQDDPTGIAPGAGYTDVLEHDFGTDTSSVIRRSTGTTTSPTTVSWTATADTWTAIAYAIGTVSYRFWGEISDLPNRWDDSGNDAYVPIVAGGILRRIQQGDRPVNSSLREYYEQFLPSDYWPLDDGSGSITGANSASGGYPWRKYGAAVATFDGDLQPLSTGFQMSTNDGLTASASVLKYPGNSVTVDFVYRPNISGLGYIQLYMGGAYKWGLVLRHDGVNNDFLVQLFTLNSSTGDTVITNVVDSAANYALVDFQLHHVRWVITNSGIDMNTSVYLDGVLVMSGTALNQQMATIQEIWATFSPQLEGAILTIGHVAIWNDGAPAPDLATTVQAFQSWAGELAAARFARLCLAPGFPSVIQGNTADTIPMGQQGTDYFSNQLTEIEATDLGLLYEPRDRFGIGYRTRASLYNQAAVITASYTGKQVTPPLEPTEDDAALRNDVFAQRRNGGSYEAALNVGPLSVNPPPLGAGRYKDEVPVNVQTDAMLPGVAGWLLRLGTVDQPRFPRIQFNLAQPAIAADAALSDGLLNAGIGDRLQINNTAALGYYDGVSQLILGYDEMIGDGGFGHVIAFNCAPAAPYEVATFDDGVSRFDPGENATLNAGLTTTSTTMAVLLAVQYDGARDYWTTAAGDMPIPITVGGEEMTVTAISAGVAGVQNFTVVRSVNGVVKTHTTGEQVYLKRPTILAL